MHPGLPKQSKLPWLIYIFWHFMLSKGFPAPQIMWYKLVIEDVKGTKLLHSHFSSLKYFIWKRGQNSPWQSLCSAISHGFNYLTKKKKTKTPQNTHDIILASPVIAGNPGPLLFSLPITTIGSSFTGQRKKPQICDSYNNTALAGLHSIASWSGHWFDATRHFLKNTHSMLRASWFISFHAQKLWKCQAAAK